MADEPTQLGVRRARRDVEKAGKQMMSEHPLDTLLQNMLTHGWGEDDPMVKWVRRAMKVPYPMPLWEALERGLLTPEELL